MSQIEKTGKSFVREAVILTVANFAVKIIGVVFKIPLTNILGTSIGIFTAAYSIYAMLFMLSTSGLPIAVSRLVAASNEQGRGREARKISNISLALFGIVGFIFMVLLIAFAPMIAKSSGHAESALAMRVIAPSLFFICVCASVRGYFQGLRNMYPTAISQFVEAFFKLCVGLGATVIAAKQGASVAVQAACAISGVSVGTLLATVFILLYRSLSKRTRPNETTSETRSTPELVKLILIVAVPITLTSAALYFSQFFDTVIIVNALVSSGESEAVSETLFSAYTGLSVPIYDLLPSALVFPIATSILPAIAASLAIKNSDRAITLTRQSIRISGIIAFPCGAFLLVTGRSCISLLYGADKWSVGMNMADGSIRTPLYFATGCLALLAIAVFFISIVSTTNSILNAYGKPYLPFISVLCGIAVLIVSEIVLLRMAGIYGAPISSVLCYAVTTVLNMYFLRRYCGVNLGLFGMFLRPFVCGVITTGVTYAVYEGMKVLWQAVSDASVDSRLGALCILLVSGIAMVITYCTSIILLKGIREDEVRLLPKGDKLASLLIKKGWLKAAED